jgi:hypothetical protein
MTAWGGVQRAFEPFCFLDLSGAVTESTRSLSLNRFTVVETNPLPSAATTREAIQQGCNRCATGHHPLLPLKIFSNRCDFS